MPDSLKRLLDIMDAGASEAEPAKGVTKGDLLNWFDEIEGLRLAREKADDAIEFLEQHSGRLRDALQFIADQQDLMFAECFVAEEIVRRAKAALER